MVYIQMHSRMNHTKVIFATQACIHQYMLNLLFIQLETARFSFIHTTLNISSVHLLNDAAACNVRVECLSVGTILTVKNLSQ